MIFLILDVLLANVSVFPTFFSLINILRYKDK